MQLHLPFEATYALVLFVLSIAHLIAAIFLGQVVDKRTNTKNGPPVAGWTIGCVASCIGCAVYGILCARAIYLIGEKLFGH